MGRINEDPFFCITQKMFYVVCTIILAYYLPILISIFVLAPFVFKIWTRLTIGWARTVQRLDGKTAIVTGSNIGIGYETAKDFAKRGARVILACRNQQKGQNALNQLKQDTGNNNIVLKSLDTSSLDSVRKFCKEINAEESRLDILVNNAGTFAPEKRLTKDNLEYGMQANHYGPFLLTHLLLDLLKRTKNARIVNVSSIGHRLVWTFDPDNLNGEKSYSMFANYSLTKLATIYFTTELARRLSAAGITPSEISVNTLHPGGIRSNLSEGSGLLGDWKTNLFHVITSFFYKTTVEGAQTTIHVAVSEDVDGVSGEYFADCNIISPSKLAKNKDNARIMWNNSVRAVSLKENETIVQI